MTTENQITTPMNCPHCNQQLTISSDLYGKNVQCPNCQKEINIPENPPVQNETVPSSKDSGTSSHSGKMISLEGVSTPDLPLNSGEIILLDIPQGFLGPWISWSDSSSQR